MKCFEIKNCTLTYLRYSGNVLLFINALSSYYFNYFFLSNWPYLFIHVHFTVLIPLSGFACLSTNYFQILFFTEVFFGVAIISTSLVLEEMQNLSFKSKIIFYLFLFLKIFSRHLKYRAFASSRKAWGRIKFCCPLKCFMETEGFMSFSQRR